MRVGINCLGFMESKRCGAEEVLLNLVRGFNYYGHGNEIVFFCYESMKSKLENLITNAEYVVINDVNISDKHELVSATRIQSNIFHKIYKNYNLDVIAFINIGVGIYKYDVPVLLVPHDIQNVSNPEKGKLRGLIKYLLYKYFYKINFEIADSIVAISEVDKQEIQECYPQYKDKVIKIYNPINFPEKLNIDKNKEKTILAVNIQYPHKNIITLIRAFEILVNQGCEYQLILVGRETDYTQKLRKYVTQHKLAHKISFLGFIDRDELIELWKKTSLYVNPSKYEGFGMTSAESLIFGAPTLLGDLPVNREITDNRCFYYKELEDEKMLAERIEEIINKNYDVETMKKNSDAMIAKYGLKTISSMYWTEFLTMAEDRDIS